MKWMYMSFSGSSDAVGTHNHRPTLTFLVLSHIKNGTRFARVPEYRRLLHFCLARVR